MIDDLKPKALELYPELRDPAIRRPSSTRTSPAPDSLNAIPEENEEVTTNEPVSDYPLEFREEDEDMLSESSSSQGEGINSEGINSEGINSEGRTQNTPSDEEENFSGEQLTNEENKNSSPDFDHEMTTSAPKHVPCPEDDDFLKDFEKLLVESINTRGSGTQSTSGIPIPVDALISSSVSITPKARKRQMYHFGDASSEEEETPKTINLMVMTRPIKGNKPVLKTVEVPAESDLGKSIILKEEAERNEKLKLKKLTLDMTERLEEAETVSSTPQITNLNRDQGKFQHQKGAPDADLIFGSKR